MTRLGRVPGFSWIERLTRPFLYPNNVPVMPVLFSGKRPPGREGSLHTGVIIGKDRNTLRKALKIFTGRFLLFFEEGLTRDNGVVGGVGGGGGNFDCGSTIAG